MNIECKSSKHFDISSSFRRHSKDRYVVLAFSVRSGLALDWCQRGRGVAALRGLGSSVDLHEGSKERGNTRLTPWTQFTFVPEARGRGDTTDSLAAVASRYSGTMQWSGPRRGVQLWDTPLTAMWVIAKSHPSMRSRSAVQ